MGQAIGFGKQSDAKFALSEKQSYQLKLTKTYFAPWCSHLSRLGMQDVLIDQRSMWRLGYMTVRFLNTHRPPNHG